MRSTEERGQFCAADLFCGSWIPQLVAQSLISQTKDLLRVSLSPLLPAVLLLLVLLQVLPMLLEMLARIHQTQELLPPPAPSPRSQI